MPGLHVHLDSAAGVPETVWHQQQEWGCPIEGPWLSVAKATQRGSRVHGGLPALDLAIYTPLWTMYKLWLGRVGAA